MASPFQKKLVKKSPKESYSLQESEDDGGFSVDRTVTQIEAVGDRTRSIFETKTGRFGRSCSHVRPGDEICILYGGRLPFILREVEPVDRLYRDDDGNSTLKGE